MCPAQTPITGHLEKSGYPYLQVVWNLEIMVSMGLIHLPHKARRAVKDWLKIEITGFCPLTSVPAEGIREHHQKSGNHY
jgi:hypothetical protein